ncbi:MAG: hemerythrin domain-containing protein [Leptospiraceae bacterium]|nr:hemerythrin domain-containing protein [Leptospiraceae bacterium]
MSGFFFTLHQDHQRCDTEMLSLEQSANKPDWQQTKWILARVHKHFECHFQVEEEILFPSLEHYLGQSMGPLAVMRMEHDQIRHLFRDLESLIEQQKDRDFNDVREALFILIQQHNAKEEQIIYPMADQYLSNDSDQILNRIISHLSDNSCSQNQS